MILQVLQILLLVCLQLLKLWYDEDYVEEESFLDWAEEKKGASEAEKKYVHLARDFLKWLEDADEEDSEEESDEDDDDDDDEEDDD